MRLMMMLSIFLTMSLAGCASPSAVVMKPKIDAFWQNGSVCFSEYDAQELARYLVLLEVSNEQ
ncbi:hypothetical protein DMV98_23925 [Vibrio parahaemolyticus]|nr:hypothetical protein [Vibrio parahaemolyticus]